MPLWPATGHPHRVTVQLLLMHMVAYGVVMLWAGYQQYQLQGLHALVSNYWKVYVNSWFWLVLPILQWLYVAPWVLWLVLRLGRAKAELGILLRGALYTSLIAGVASQWVMPYIAGLR
jgi:hypothetical protein